MAMKATNYFQWITYYCFQVGKKTWIGLLVGVFFPSFRLKCITAKRGWEERLAMMKEKLDLISHECKNKIKEIKEQVEHQVCLYVRRLWARKVLTSI